MYSHAVNQQHLAGEAGQPQCISKQH